MAAAMRSRLRLRASIATQWGYGRSLQPASGTGSRACYASDIGFHTTGLGAFGFGHETQQEVHGISRGIRGLLTFTGVTGYGCKSVGSAPSLPSRWRDCRLLSSICSLANYGSVQPYISPSSRKRGWRTLQLAVAVGGIRHQQSPSSQWLVQRWLADKKRRQARQKRLLGRSELASSSTHQVQPSLYSNNEDRDPSQGQPPLSQPLKGSLLPTSPEEEKVAPVLARPDLLITRNVEWANLAIGFEQQNRYVIMDPRQPHAPVGYILEDSNVLLRQFLRTRRPFVASVLDANGNEVCRVRRPIWFINSAIYVEIDGKVVGECHRRWHLWRRLYDIYLGNKQFAAVENPGLWHWTFTLKDQDQGTLAEIDRNWRGFGYEFLTDAGQYAIRFGDVLPARSSHYSAPVFAEGAMPNRKPLLSTTQGHSGMQEMQQLQMAAKEAEELQVTRPLTLTERAVVLALAVSLDNDYFSRHSHPGWGMPLPFFGSDMMASGHDHADTVTSEAPPVYTASPGGEGDVERAGEGASVNGEAAEPPSGNNGPPLDMGSFFGWSDEEERSEQNDLEPPTEALGDDFGGFDVGNDDW